MNRSSCGISAPAIAVWAFFAALACGKKEVKVSLDNASKVALPGEAIVVSANVTGDYEKTEWRIVKTLPPGCAGKLSVDDERAVTAEFRAPATCSTGKAENVISVLGGFRDGQQATATTIVETVFSPPSPPAATQTSEPPPARPSGSVPGEAEVVAGLPTIVPLFKTAGETYVDFLDAGFKARHELAPDNILVLLATPTRGGFGGTCLEVGGSPVDLRGFRSIVTEAAYHSGGGRVEVKLEQADSSVHDGTIVVGHIQLSSTMQRTHRFSIEELPTVLRRATKRVCISTTAPQIVPPGSAGVRIHKVSFEK